VRTTASILAFFLSAAAIAADGVEDRTEKAGRLLSDAKLELAADAAKACGEPRCALILARALFRLGHFDAAAAALDPVRGKLGDLAAHGEVLRGEALLLAGRAKDALDP
jgi:hypothetical protein